jgi:hypothetical protein
LSIGFSRNQNAPRSRTVWTAVSTLPNAVTTIVGGMSPISFRRWRKPNPSRPGIFKSVMITSAGKELSLASASFPSAAISGRIPHAESMAARPVR